MARARKPKSIKRKRHISRSVKRDSDLENTLRLIPGYDPFATAGDCWLNADAAHRAIRFFPAMLRHVEGAVAGRPFVLEPWQQAVVGNLFGWMRRDEQRRIVRRYRKCFIRVGRKNGKTPLGAGICLKLLFSDKERGAEIYCAAADRQQAALLYRHARGMVLQEPELSSRAKMYDSPQYRSIVYNAMFSSMKVISAEAYSKHGFNPHAVIVDELHAQPNRDLVEVIESAFVSLNRAQPLLVYLTTSDYDRDSVCNEEDDYAARVRDGIIDNQQYLPVIYEVPKDADWNDESLWHLANPNLGVSVSMDALRAEHDKAVELPSRENVFRRLHLNQRTEQDVRWLNIEAWDACRLTFTAADMGGIDSWAGLDLSSTTDLTAFVIVFRRDGAYYVLPFFWVPADTIERRAREDKVPYPLWVKQGILNATPGNVVDYDFVRTEVTRLCREYHVREIGYDPWNATQIVTQLQAAGFKMVEVRQGFATLTSPTKELEKLVLGRQLRHDGNPILRWMASNVTTEQDAAGNLKPSKKKSTERIDGIVALIIALNRALVDVATQSVYESKDLLIL
ncbi:MAG TPA: terminase TerL endonuclease subunit [Planctomycetota bacterium]|nr:terminase TerL endonuclease subunit [Planctomycetota bacterium]